MKKYLFSFIVLLFSSASSQLTVAVLDFEGIGVSENEARALSGRFGNEFMILSKGVYTLVERNRMGQILKEQGFQNTGIVSSEDAVKLGEALGADYIVTGSISKVGALFSINARLLKVESGEIIKSSSHDHMGDIMDLMRKGIKESATKLLELEEKKETPSIAILPFENKGADEDAFYAYGIGADLVSDVTGAGLIRVAGLKDVEKIDYLNMSYDEMAKSLLVRYVAQGTLWKLGGLFQLSLEIFDTKSSQVIFTKRWQTEWGNLTTIKDDLSSNILETLEIEVKRGTPNKFTIDTEAYEFYLKGKHAFQKAQTIEERQIARGLFERAVEIDEDIRKLWPYQGDSIFQGRWGNSIRFGSNIIPDAHGDGDDKPDSPNIIIRAGQLVDADAFGKGGVVQNLKDSPSKPVNEDINADGSSVWITTDQSIKLDIKGSNAFSHDYMTSLQSDDQPTNGGKQIVVNSDRITFNTKQGKILGFSHDGIGFSTQKSFSVDADDGMKMNSGGATSMDMVPGGISLITPGNSRLDLGGGGEGDADKIYLSSECPSFLTLDDKAHLESCEGAIVHLDDCAGIIDNQGSFLRIGGKALGITGYVKGRDDMGQQHLVYGEELTNILDSI